VRSWKSVPSWALRQRLENGDWFVDGFPRLRNQLVGVGCQAVLAELAKVQTMP
jgi:hypothetical protein